MSILSTNLLKNDTPYQMGIRIYENMTVMHIRPHLQIAGPLVDGSIFVRVYQNTTMLKEVEVTYDQINTEIVDPYAHGFFTFDFDGLVLHHDFNDPYTDYTVEIEMKNHTDSDTVYAAIVADMNTTVYGTHDTVSDIAYGFHFYIL